MFLWFEIWVDWGYLFYSTFSVHMHLLRAFLGHAHLWSFTGRWLCGCVHVYRASCAPYRAGVSVVQYFSQVLLYICLEITLHQEIEGWIKDSKWPSKTWFDFCHHILVDVDFILFCLAILNQHMQLTNVICFLVWRILMAWSENMKLSIAKVPCITLYTGVLYIFFALHKYIYLQNKTQLLKSICN